MNIDYSQFRRKVVGANNNEENKEGLISNFSYTSGVLTNPVSTKVE